ncbi:MAG: hypothetical protein ACTSQJ_00620 [Promethearchaeota archaeon]
MPKKKLTEAYIKENINPNNITLNISLSDVKDIRETQYLLIIQSIIEGCKRINIYPINCKKILKIIIHGENISDNYITELSRIIKQFDIIHTSGLILKGKDLYYECYLNLNLSDYKTKDLKISLDKFRNIFKLIKIEEIGLKRTIKI